MLLSKAKNARPLLIIAMFMLAIAGTANLALARMHVSEDPRDFAVGALYGISFGLVALYFIVARRERRSS
jgi:hypothetical protein